MLASPDGHAKNSVWIGISSLGLRAASNLGKRAASYGTLAEFAGAPRFALSSLKLS
jgi:hypothetical protein